ncbi:MAG: putative sulfate exporter family transporter [Erythrobacter sp.]
MRSSTRTSPDIFIGDLYGEVQLGTENAATQGSVWPGLLLCATAAGAAAWVADHYGFPVILLGLLVGLALNFAAQDSETHRGLDLASGTFLRIGIVLLGFKVSLAQVAMIGTSGFVALCVVMVLTLAAGLLFARIARLSPSAGLIAGGATAICGASAALALYAIVGKERLSQAQFTLTLVGISIASAVAMTTYPILGAELALTDQQAGFLIGASIHDVAQAIGGGYAFSDNAGEIATIIKLTRVALLVPLVFLAGLFFRAPDGTEGPQRRRLAVPWFVALFAIVAAGNSVWPVPAEYSETTLTVAKGLLLLAVTATAMRARLDLLRSLGWRSSVPIAGTTLTSFVAALVACLMLT